MVTFGEGLGMTREQVLNRVPSIPMRMGIQYWDNVSRTRPWLQRVRGKEAEAEPGQDQASDQGHNGSAVFYSKRKRGNRAVCFLC
jgi:hypothetical protein